MATCNPAKHFYLPRMGNAAKAPRPGFHDSRLMKRESTSGGDGNELVSPGTWASQAQDFVLMPALDPGETEGTMTKGDEPSIGSEADAAPKQTASRTLSSYPLSCVMEERVPRFLAPITLIGLIAQRSGAVIQEILYPICVTPWHRSRQTSNLSPSFFSRLFCTRGERAGCQPRRRASTTDSSGNLQLWGLGPLSSPLLFSGG